VLKKQGIERTVIVCFVFTLATFFVLIFNCRRFFLDFLKKLFPDPRHQEKVLIFLVNHHCFNACFLVFKEIVEWGVGCLGLVLAPPALIHLNNFVLAVKTLNVFHTNVLQLPA